MTWTIQTYVPSEKIIETNSWSLGWHRHSSRGKDNKENQRYGREKIK